MDLSGLNVKYNHQINNCHVTPLTMDAGSEGVNGDTTLLELLSVVTEGTAAFYLLFKPLHFFIFCLNLCIDTGLEDQMLPPLVSGPL